MAKLREKFLELGANGITSGLVGGLFAGTIVALISAWLDQENWSQRRLYDERKAAYIGWISEANNMAGMETENDRTAVFRLARWSDQVMLVSSQELHELLTLWRVEQQQEIDGEDIISLIKKAMRADLANP